MAQRDILFAEEVNVNIDAADGVIFELNNFKTTETVRGLKMAIAAKLNNAAEWESLAVAYVDVEMTDLNATLASYGVQDTDILFFARLVSPQDPKSATNPPAYSEKILNNVLFNSLKGQTLTLHQVSLSSTVAELKQRLGREKSINMSELRLICCGKQWDDNRTLLSYDLQENSTIQLVARLRGGQ